MQLIEKHMYILSYWRLAVLLLVCLVLFTMIGIRLWERKRKVFSVLLVTCTCLLTVLLYYMPVYKGYFYKHSELNSNPNRSLIVGTWKGTKNKQIVLQLDGKAEILSKNLCITGSWVIGPKDKYEDVVPLIVIINGEIYRKYKCFSLFNHNCLNEYKKFCDTGFYEISYYQTDADGGK